MLEHDVVFLVLKETSSYFHSVEEDAAAATLVYYMKEAGLQNLSTFPATDEDKYSGTIYSQFMTYLDKNTAPIFCISCWTSTYAIASDFAEMIRARYPRSLIIAGGVHFNSLGETEHSLYKGTFDVVFRGGGDSFLEFIKLSVVEKKLKIYKEKGEIKISGATLGKGAYYLKNRKIQNTGRGSFNRPVVPLLGVTNDCIDTRILLHDTCPNACDYCFIQPSGINCNYWASLIKWVGEFSGQVKKTYKKDVVLSLSDSAPFNKSNRKRTLDYLDMQKKNVRFDGMNVFVDPSDLDEEFYHIVEEHDINNFFIGRDRIISDNFVGRRLNGLERSSEQLDQELDLILNFMAFLNTRKNKLQNEIYIGYIVSPYESAKYSRKLIDELSGITMHNSKLTNVRVQSNLFILNPYPGTKVAQKAKGEFIAMRYFYHPYPNVWVGKNTVNIYLEVIRLIVAKMFCNNINISFYKPILEMAHSLQFQTDYNYKLIDDIEDVSLRSFAYKIIEDIFKMELGKERTLNEYLENVKSIYYIGCMVSLVINKPELLKYKNLYSSIVKEDKSVAFLMKDLNLLKEYALAGKAPVLDKYL
jgi:hypothetical protein